MIVFKTQTLLDIYSGINIDTAGATVTEILYRKPSGIKGAWTATITGSNEIMYSVQTNDIDEAGVWHMHAKVVIGGRTGYGEVVPVRFDTPLD